MRTLQTEVLVIGGGATGCGVLRDLAMRGYAAILVEKGDLAYGTTGRYHGLLHSGGRYAVKDPQAAVECIKENRILRHIMPHCIEDTGGFFVLTPWDNPDYASLFIENCHKAVIPIEEISLRQMLLEEPLLNPRISRCFRLPDASADSFLAADANAESAREHGASLFTYHKVVGLIREGDKVIGARCHNLADNQLVEIRSNLIINASGAWAGLISSLAKVNVPIVPGKGTMIAMNHRIVNTVINRCKTPSDGDILVPAHTVSVIGTTDVQVHDPDHLSIEPWEVHLMLEEGEKLVPGFKNMRVLRAWAGVRPLYQEQNVSDTRLVTRAFVLIDHEDQDCLGGFITITSGKWTTYRKMAEVTVDLVGHKLGNRRPCRTHLEILPESKKHRHHYLGARLAQIEEAATYGKLICECELATVKDVRRAISEGQARTIDDIRRDVRIGMGPCQGGFCTYRIAGILHDLRRSPIEQTNVALRDFLEERWRGLRPILWGQQLRQERLDELIYISLLNADRLPGSISSPFSPSPYELTPLDTASRILLQPNVETSSYPVHSISSHAKLDVLVIGAGLSGLTAAWQAASRGLNTHLIAKGWGALYWHTGCIDVLGYHPIDADIYKDSPSAELPDLIQKEPNHPYALAGIRTIEEALLAFQYLCAQAGYPMHGSIAHNWLLPTALGTARPTCLAPETMIEGDLHHPGSILVVGFTDFYDFYPGLIADNLSAQGIPARGLLLDIPSLQQKRLVTGRMLAQMFEESTLLDEIVHTIKSSWPKVTEIRPVRIGFPAVLGLGKPLVVKRKLEEALGLPVFEIPTLPPSIPGIRLTRLLIQAIEQAGGHAFDGMQVVSSDINNGIVWSEAAARLKPHHADKIILATGGILGGGIQTTYEGFIQEAVCSLPIQAPVDRTFWLNNQFLGPKAHPIFTSGITVNNQFQPVNEHGRVHNNNLFAIGTTLSGADYLRQRSFDGVALVTGYFVGQNL